MKRLAICSTCKTGVEIEFAGDPVQCEACQNDLRVSDGTLAGFFLLFHEVFPAFEGKAQRARLARVVRKITFENVTVEEALEFAELPPETNAFLRWLADHSIELFMVFLTFFMFMRTEAHEAAEHLREQEQSQAIQEIRLERPDRADGLRGFQSDRETIAGTPASPQSQARIRKRAQGRSGASPKGKQQTGRPQSGKKKKPSPSDDQ